MLLLSLSKQARPPLLLPVNPRRARTSTTAPQIQHTAPDILHHAPMDPQIAHLLAIIARQPHPPLPPPATKQPPRVPLSPPLPSKNLSSKPSPSASSSSSLILPSRSNTSN